MPKRVYQNPGVLETITRPVVIDIARQMLEYTGLPGDTKIQYPGDAGIAFQPSSTISNDAEFNSFSSQSQLQIQVEETYQQDRILSTAVYYPDSPFIFVDPETKVYVRPMYSPTDLALNITYRATDKDAAIRWRNDIRSRVSMNRESRIHQIRYSYLFDPMVIETLQFIQAMQENVAPYGRTFDEYVKLYADSRMRQLVTLAGTNPTWGVAETQGRVLGYFDFEGAPEEGQAVDGNAAWIIGFTYRIKYDKPIATVMDYPLMIHNQLIDERYRDLSLVPTEENHQSTYSLSSGALSHFENYRKSEKRGYPGVAIPDIDEFTPAPGSVPVFTTRIATLLTSIDEDNPLKLLDLSDDLGDYALDPVIENFMRGEGNYLTQHGNSILNVSVYCDDVLMNRNHYYMDNNLVVWLKEQPDLRKVYHVRLAIYNNPIGLSQMAKDRLRKDCRAAFKLFEALNADIVTKGILTKCLINNTVPRQEFADALSYLDVGSNYNNHTQDVQFNTVMLLTVTAKRSETHALG